jgi:hypothetical protein
MNLPDRRADTLILQGDRRVRVRVRVRIRGENRTRTPTRTLKSLQIRCVCPGKSVDATARKLLLSLCVGF